MPKLIAPVTFASTALMLIVAMGTHAQASETFGHVFIVVEENHDFADVIGNTAECPYINALADKYGLATQFYGNTHPSIGNYMEMTVGLVATNDNAFTGTVTADNVVRHMVAAGITWKVYAESLAFAGDLSLGSYPYARKHNPFAYFSDVKNDPALAKNIVPFTQFATDLANNALPQYCYIIPNLLNDAHDGTLAQSDQWLQTNIKPLVDSAMFQKDGLLILTTDEAETDSTSGGGRITHVIASPKCKPGYKSTTFYQHQSTLRLSMSALGMTSFPNDGATAPVMDEFFTSTPTNNPPIVSLTSPTNGQAFSAPANITLSASASDGDGSVSKVDFYRGSTLIGSDASSPYSIAWNNVAAGSYALTAKATDNAGAMATSGTVNITVSSQSQSPYSGTAMAIPGMIKVAEYDKGGEGVAYHDVDTVNYGSNSYRPGEGVDSTGSGVGWIVGSEWLEYAVNVAAAGSYVITIPVSQTAAGATMHVSFGGVNATGSMSIPNTGNWSVSQNITASVNLSAGTQIMQVAFDANGANGYGPGLGDISIVPAGGGTVGNGTGLSGQYFDNADFTGTNFTRTDAAVNFDWGTGAPTSSMGVDYFSVRWIGQVQAQFTQAYTFYVTGDDGVRLWVNGQLLVDKWLQQVPTEYAATINLTAGTKYDIKLEYYENYGGAVAQLRWSSASTPKAVIPASQLYVPGSGGGTGLSGQYFDNADFTGATFTRTDTTVNFDWGTGAPTASMGVDYFSVRWSGQVRAQYTQAYTFYVTGDDGVRLWINGQLLIDQWRQQVPTEYAATVNLTAGTMYDVKIEYYENYGGAVAQLRWSSASTPKAIIPTSQLFPPVPVPMPTGIG